MKTIKTIGLVSLSVLILTGCGSSNQEYLEAVKAQNAQYMEAYKTVENETVVFNGTFNGEVKMIKPKKLPQLQQIKAPKSGSEIALDWAKLIVPTVGTVAGFHYNYMTADSANKYNAQSIEAWTGNFQNTTNTSSEINNTSNTTNTSESVTSTSDTSVTSDISVTDTSTTSDTNTENTVPVTINDTETTVGQ